MKPIYITHKLRVTDYDANQYCVEKRGGIDKKTGEHNWIVMSYNTSVKSLITSVRGRLGCDAANEARDIAEAEYDRSDVIIQLDALPAKPTKKKS